MKRENTSLYYSFIKKFVILIIVPFLVIISFFSGFANKVNEQNSKILSEKLFNKTIFSLQQKLNGAQELALSLNTNQRLISFLDRDYKETIDLEYYETVIYNNVLASTGYTSDNTIKILYENQTIPAGYSIFYHIDDMLKVKQIRDFYDNPSLSSLWIDGNTLQNIPPHIQFNPYNSYCYLKKIQIREKKLGLILISVPRSLLFDKDNKLYSQENPFNLSNTSIITYNYTDQPIDDEMIKTITSSTKETVTIGDSMVNLHQTKEYPFNIVTITPKNKYNQLVLIVLLTFILFFVVAIIVFIRFIKNIINDINYCLDGMNESINDGFKTVLMVKRHDEISKISERINFLIHQIQQLIQKTVNQQLAAKETQLMALQHQINPHFLYNTMEIFSSRMEVEGLYKESSAMAAFCRILRYNINSDTMLSSFREEINQITDYISIQKLKNIEISLNIDIKEYLKDESIIKFILQPFVENSVKYRRENVPLFIDISVKEVDSMIEVTITDNGEGISPRQLSRLNNMFKTNNEIITHNEKSIGLFNINKRLVLFYGPRSAITAKRNENGTTFSFSIDPAANIGLSSAENN